MHSKITGEGKGLVPILPTGGRLEPRDAGIISPAHGPLLSLSHLQAHQAFCNGISGQFCDGV